MNNVIFGYTPDEISDLGYQKADVEKACSILRNIVGLIRRNGLKGRADLLSKGLSRRCRHGEIQKALQLCLLQDGSFYREPDDGFLYW